MYMNWYFWIINIYIVVVYSNNDKFNVTFTLMLTLYNNLTFKMVNEYVSFSASHHFVDSLMNLHLVHVHELIFMDYY